MPRAFSLFRFWGIFCLLLGISNGAFGSLLTYRYEGLPLFFSDSEEARDPYCRNNPLGYECQDQIGAATILITIDESSLPGNTLADVRVEIYSSTLGFSASTTVTHPDAIYTSGAECTDVSPESDCWFAPPGVIAYGASEVNPLVPHAFAETYLVFDAGRNIVDWEINIADGPPDLIVSASSGDYLNAYFNWHSSEPGTWSRVSEPSMLALATLGLVGLLSAALLRRREVLAQARCRSGRLRAGPAAGQGTTISAGAFPAILAGDCSRSAESFEGAMVRLPVSA